jgi:F0F1-type ATP synthase assembly protein I
VAKRPRKSDALSQIAFYSGLGFIIPGAAVAGYFLGSLVDGQLHSGSTGAFVGTLLGAAGGIGEVLQLVLRMQKSDERKNDSSGDS